MFCAPLGACGNDTKPTVIEGKVMQQDAPPPAAPSSEFAALAAAQMKKDKEAKESGAAAESGNATERKPYGQNPKDYVLVFADEFNGFNPNLWNEAIWYEKPHPIRNFTVEDGKLKIWPQRDADGKFFNRTLDTDGKYYQKYGYFEMEAKLPRGKGTWPAFWLFNHIGNRRPEIDIMEAYAGGEGWGFKDAKGVHRPNVYAPTVWLDKEIEVAQKMYPTNTDLSEGFHKYAVKWEPNRQTFYFDGKEVLKVNVTMGDPKYILLDLWFGGASGEPNEKTPEGKSNSFEVNYVRAWQFKSQME
jgi:beta-glucanase (GH16 family)